MKLGLRRSGPFDELRQILLLETAVISRRLLLGRTLRGRIETAGIKNQRDGMLAEPAGRRMSAAAAAGRILPGPDPGVGGTLRQMKTSAKSPFAVTPGAGKTAAFQQSLGRLQLGGAGNLLQSLFKTFFHQFPKLHIHRAKSRPLLRQIGT